MELLMADRSCLQNLKDDRVETNNIQWPQNTNITLKTLLALAEVCFTEGLLVVIWQSTKISLISKCTNQHVHYLSLLKLQNGCRQDIMNRIKPPKFTGSSHSNSPYFDKSSWESIKKTLHVILLTDTRTDGNKNITSLVEAIALATHHWHYRDLHS